MKKFILITLTIFGLAQAVRSPEFYTQARARLDTASTPQEKLLIIEEIIGRNKELIADWKKPELKDIINSLKIRPGDLAQLKNKIQLQQRPQQEIIEEEEEESGLPSCAICKQDIQPSDMASTGQRFNCQPLRGHETIYTHDAPIHKACLENVRGVNYGVPSCPLCRAQELYRRRELPAIEQEEGEGPSQLAAQQYQVAAIRRPTAVAASEFEAAINAREELERRIDTSIRYNLIETLERLISTYIPEIERVFAQNLAQQRQYFAQLAAQIAVNQNNAYALNTALRYGVNITDEMIQRGFHNQQGLTASYLTNRRMGRQPQAIRREDALRVAEDIRNIISQNPLGGRRAPEQQRGAPLDEQITNTILTGDVAGLRNLINEQNADFVLSMAIESNNLDAINIALDNGANVTNDSIANASAATAAELRRRKTEEDNAINVILNVLNGQLQYVPQNRHNELVTDVIRRLCP